MIELYHNKKDCCGCGACEQICPKHAITMSEDENGFIYPVITPELCIECGACKSVCGYQNYSSNNTPDAVYAVANNDAAMLKRSTSGGAFAALATVILKEGGVAFGATMIKENNAFTVKHIKIGALEELNSIQGSKYVQSEIRDTYIAIKKELCKGNTVLFSGTPCQVAGLNAYLRTKYEKLYTVDIVCHGVPSIKMFRDYISEVEDKIGSTIDKYDFRTKDIGWGLDGKYFYKQAGIEKSKRENSNLSSYYSMFLNREIYRENCYSCKFANVSRPADLTIGDYWGIEKEQPEALTYNGGALCEENGISCILVNTDKGRKLFEKAKADLVSVESTIEQVRKYNGQLNSPSEKGKNRNTIFALYRDGGYKKVESWFWKDLGLKKYYYEVKTLVPRKLRKSLKRGVAKITGS